MNKFRKRSNHLNAKSSQIRVVEVFFNVNVFIVIFNINNGINSKVPNEVQVLCRSRILKLCIIH